MALHSIGTDSKAPKSGRKIAAGDGGRLADLLPAADQQALDQMKFRKDHCTARSPT